MESGQMSKRWDEFVYWCSRYYEDRDAFDRQERNLTLRVAEKAVEAREAVLSGSDEWAELVRKPLGSHLCHHFPKMEFDRWLEANPDRLRSALNLLWEPKSGPGERIDHFLEFLPPDVQRAKLSEPAVVLHTAMGVEQFPTYRPTKMQSAFCMTGYPDFKEAEVRSRGERYEHVLTFFDRLIEESALRGLRVRDRLDAQGLTWAVTYWRPPEHWKEADRARILEFRGDRPPESAIRDTSA
jgi:hypothetical protein